MIHRRALLFGSGAALLRAQRPRYGGVLRIAAPMPIAPFTSDPLVMMDGRGRVWPGLAMSWQHDAAFRSWRFQLRPDARTHDGNRVTGELVSQALAGMFKDRRWTGQGGVVTAESDRPMARLPAEVAQPEAAIAGTGPFRTARYDAGNGARLEAFDGHWGGRPFPDGIDLRFGRAEGVDVVEMGPVEMRRQKRRAFVSEPLDLIALVFDRSRPAVQAEALRRGLGLAVDREPIVNVILQKQGEAAGSLVPRSVSGYGYLFPGTRDLAAARKLPGPAEPIRLQCDPGDAVLPAIAERVALNAREAGIVVRVAEGGAADVHLRRVRGQPVDPYLALAHYSRGAGLGEPEGATTLEELYLREEALLAGNWVIPLFHVPVIYGLSARLRNWPSPGLPPWRFEEAWLA